MLALTVWFLLHGNVFLFFLRVFHLTKAFFFNPLFSPIAPWSQNPSCGNGGFCCISQFISWGKLWSGTPTHPTPPLLSYSHPCSSSSFVREGSENIYGDTVVGFCRDPLTFNDSLTLWCGFPLGAHLVEHWFSKYPPSLFGTWITNGIHEHGPIERSLQSPEHGIW